jgi:ceramide glucosyltransferase
MESCPTTWAFLYWFFVGPALLLAILALRGERAAFLYVQRELAAMQGVPTPPATVIVPVKGHDEGLAANLAALASLDYPDYELIVVVRRACDLPAGVLPRGARLLVVADTQASADLLEDPDTGEKIGNLIVAVRAARPESEILAFADSDGLVRSCWLRALVTALRDPSAGAASSYRLYVPEYPTFWTLLRSVWNSVIAGLFGRERAPFAWGGAMALRREVYHGAEVERFWRGHVSDDLRLTHAMKAAGLRIRYAPGATVASVDHTTGREFLDWARRQLTLSRVFHPALWWSAFVATLLYCGAMVAGIAAIVSGHRLAWIPLGIQLSAGMWKGSVRGRLFALLLPERGQWWARHNWVNTWWVPLGTWIWLVTFLLSATSNTIRWRGVRYRLSPQGCRKL